MTEIYNAISRQLSMRVLVFFSGETAAATDISDSVIGASVEYQGLASDTAPYGQVATNTISLQLDNYDRRFTPTNTSSDLFGKLTDTNKMICYISCTADNVTEETLLGTFYTGDWDANTDSKTAQCTAYDRLYKYNKVDLPLIPVYRNVTILTLFSVLFRALGLLPTEFIIDTALAFNVDYGWIPGTTVSESLKSLCVAGACTVSVNRDNQIVVTTAFRKRTPVTIVSENNQIISTSQQQSMYRKYSGVMITYSIFSTEQSLEPLTTLSELSLTAGDNELKNLSMNSDLVHSITSFETKSTEDIEIKSFTYSPEAVTLLVDTADACVADIKVYGYNLKETTRDIKVGDTSGSEVLKVSSQLLQNEAAATEYATVLNQIATDPSSYVVVQIRGNPEINLFDEVTLIDHTNNLGEIKAVVTRISLAYDGGLTGVIECTRSSSLALYSWAYLGPGQYIRLAKQT